MSRTRAIRAAIAAAGAALALAGLYRISRTNFLLFHSLTELFSVAVAFGIFMIAWNTRHLVDATFVLVLGVAYLFVGGVDLLHTLAYGGMRILRDEPGSNLATQLWVAGRFLESSSLVLAFFFANRRLKVGWLMAVYASACCLLLLAIFGWRVFPTCFDERTGLTPFKKASEIVVIAVLAAALALLLRHRRRFDRWVLLWLALSVVLTMASEWCFMLYRANPFGFYSELGHFIKLASFYLIYKAIIETGLRRPYAVLFRDLRHSQQALRKARDELEERVRQRTVELSDTVDALQEEMVQRTTAQERLRRSEQRLFSVLNMLPGYVALIDRDYRVRFANHRFREIFGEPGDRPWHAVLMGRDQPEGDSPIEEILESGRTRAWEWTSPARRVYRAWGYPFSDIDGSSVVLTLGLDITEQKDLERRVIDTSEAERRSIGRDLHDSLGQKLTGLGLLSEAVAAELKAASSQGSALVEQMVALARASVAEVRALSKGLDPVSLEHSGLVASLVELAETTRAQSGLTCECHFDEGVRIDDPAVATHLYRIAQEAVNNAVKHSRGRRIDITLREEDSAISLAVRDDGVGPPDAGSEPGMGMRTMRYRAGVMGGSLEIRARGSGGTLVRCSVPRPARALDGDSR